MPMQPCQLQQVLKSLQACNNCSCVKWDAACAKQAALTLPGCLQRPLQGWPCNSCCCIRGNVRSHICAIHAPDTVQQEPL